MPLWVRLWFLFGYLFGYPFGYLFGYNFGYNKLEVDIPLDVFDVMQTITALHNVPQSTAYAPIMSRSYTPGQIPIILRRSEDQPGYKLICWYDEFTNNGITNSAMMDQYVYVEHQCAPLPATRPRPPPVARSP